MSLFLLIVNASFSIHKMHIFHDFLEILETVASRITEGMFLYIFTIRVLEEYYYPRLQLP